MIWQSLMQDKKIDAELQCLSNLVKSTWTMLMSLKTAYLDISFKRRLKNTPILLATNISFRLDGCGHTCS